MFSGKDHIYSLDIGIFMFKQPLVSISIFFPNINPTLPFSNRSFSWLHFILSGKENRWPLFFFEKNVHPLQDSCKQDPLFDLKCNYFKSHKEKQKLSQVFLVKLTKPCEIYYSGRCPINRSLMLATVVI